MTFADVARRVGLNTTSVTYYFKRKEDLAQACFEHTLLTLGDMLDEAQVEATPEARVAKYLSLNMARFARIREHDERALAIAERLARDGGADARPADGGLARHIPPHPRIVGRRRRRRRQKDLNGARAHVLLENTFWIPAWINRYDLDQFDRVEARLMDMFRHGIAIPGATWSPTMLDIEHEEAEPGREAFLRAATRLINELGYRGASVQRIASELNVTKGSFYHHLDAKDDLVIECYKRSFDTIIEAQQVGEAAGGDWWHRLSSVIATLLDVQFSVRGPLLRTTALTGLPRPVRSAMIDRSNRIARRYAGMLSDGAAEGSVRAVDPLIVSQSLMALQNAAFDMRKWASDDAARARRGDVCIDAGIRAVRRPRQRALSEQSSCRDAPARPADF